ncbi:MAG: 4-hydroxy-tetrahydrodipicolinate synthase [Thiothrix litoralis]
MKSLRGSFVAIVTPMQGDGSVDFNALERLINWQIEQGSDGIVTVGTTGESATLDDAEHCAVIRETVRIVAGRVPVIAGTGANATMEAIHLTECAAKAGVDACLLVTPYYNKPTQEGLFQHYKAVAEAVDIPQILYNVPGRTCCDMANETVIRLAGIRNIIGLKDATGELERLPALRSRLPEGFLLYSGDDATACNFLLAGGDGVISVTGNIAPQNMQAMVTAALLADEPTARRFDQKLQGLHKQLFIESSPIPSKWALHKMSLITNGIRLPLTWLTPASEASVAQAMQQAGIE